MRVTYIDFDGCIGDTLGEIKDAFDIDESFVKEVHNSENIFYVVKKGMDYLKGTDIDDLGCLMIDFKPFPGAVETVRKLQEYGAVKILTDNPLLALEPIKKIIKERYHLRDIDDILTSTAPEVVGGRLTGNFVVTSPKDILLEKDFRENEYSELYVIIQGVNDIPVARKSKKMGGVVLGVNSNSPELVKLSDRHYPTIFDLYVQEFEE